MRKEIGTLITCSVFRFLEAGERLPEGKKAFPLHLVLTKKYDQVDHVSKYKARLVLDGSKQRPYVDYFQSYAPVVDFSSLQIFISYAHAKGWRLQQYDIVSAFTNARPQSQTFVRFVFGDVGDTERSC